MTSSIIRAIEEDHVSTEDHLRRPPGWDPLNYSYNDHIFEKLGYKIKRYTSRPPSWYIKATTGKWTGPTPTETIVIRGKKCELITEKDVERKRLLRKLNRERMREMLKGTSRDPARRRRRTRQPRKTKKNKKNP